MVSVIITTYNRRRFLREAVLSVARQDYEDKEIIVVDDGSGDSSREEVRDLPVRYLWKPNGGISSARNAGIGIAKGGYVAFLDVDDLWKKGKLSLQMKVMKESGVPLCYTDEIWIRNEKRLNQGLRHRKYSGAVFEKCLPLCIISPSSVVIERSLFDDVGLFDENMPVCEDYDMWLRITCKYPVLFVEKPLIIKRGGHEDQLSRSYPAMDRFRIASIVKSLESGILNPSQRTAALEELSGKCRVYGNGALKRNRVDEAAYYLSLPHRFT